MKAACLSLFVALLVSLGIVAVAQDLAVLEFDLYPSQYETSDICVMVPEWLLDQLAEHSPYSCEPMVLTREQLRAQRIIGSDLVITPDAIAKLLTRQGYSYLVIGSVTVDIFSGSVSVTASLIDSSGSVSESGTIISPSVQDLQIHMRELCFALLDQEPPTGNAPPVAKISIQTQVSPHAPGASTVTVFRNERVTLDASGSYDIDGEIERIEWDLDADEVADEYQAVILCDSIADIPGSHEITLRVVDGFGATDEETLHVVVLEDDVQDAALDSNLRPHAIAAVVGEDGEELDRPAYKGEVITLDAVDSYDPDGRIASYSWDLDQDGIADHVAQTFTTRSLTSEEGTRVVELCVEDDLGMRACSELVMEVSSTTYEEYLASRNLAPVVYIDVQRDTATRQATGSPYVLLLDERVTLSGVSSYDPDGRISQWVWRIEGDSTPIGYRSTLTMSDLAAFPGQRTITLEATDNEGAVSRKSVVLTVLDYSLDQVAEKNIQENVIPALRQTFMVLMGIGLLVGVGYLIWYFGW